MPKLFLETERMANLASGLGQLCLHLGHQLVRQRPPDWELTFLVPRQQVGMFGDSVNYVVATRWRRLLRLRGYDVWHCLYQGSRFLPGGNTALVYTILDLNYLAMPDYSSQRKVRQKARYQHRINRASVVTTISDYVARDVRRQMVMPPQTPLEVIYCGVDVPTDALTTLPTVQPDGPFLFFVGMIHPNKNVHTLLPLLQAFPHYRLVLAGPDTGPYGQQIREQARQMGVADRLLMPGAIDEPTKWWLYAHCDALLFPSLLEGFGLPVVEAMAFGKPVFCSTATSLPEVGGQEAFYFPSFEPETVVDTFRRGMTTYCNNPDFADRLRQRSRRFRWDAIATNYWRLYQGLLA